MTAVHLSARVTTSNGGEPFVARVTQSLESSPEQRSREAYLVPNGESPTSLPDGFAAILRVGRGGVDAIAGEARSLVITLPDEFSYLSPGDIVRISPGGQQLRVLYRKASRFNALLVTERCNSNCVMCSQPPRAADDSYLVEELVQAIGLMSPDTAELGLTGGEPTLLHDGLVRIIETARDRLPATALHMLSNGRLFAYLAYVRRIAEIRHPDFMIGIPVYSDLPRVHDFVVQAHGAFDETLRGLLNLGRFGQRVEVRVVIHRHTYRRLPQLGAFLARNLPFVEHVALMGLEMMGYTRMNLDALWIDPADYQDELARCVDALSRGGSRVSIYNHQLCVLDPELWRYARQSISDWKNIYLPVCDRCVARNRCGGFFASAAVRHSAHIHAVEQGVRAD